MLEIILGIFAFVIVGGIISKAKSEYSRHAAKRREIDAMLAQYERELRERGASGDEIVGALIRHRKHLYEVMHMDA